MTATFNDAYLDTWTGRRLLVLRELGELPEGLAEELARAKAQGLAAPAFPEAELRPVLACTTDEALEVPAAQRERLERLKDAVMADFGQPPQARGRFPLSEARQAELWAILAAGAQPA